jgi:hypothetical protein
MPKESYLAVKLQQLVRCEPACLPTQTNCPKDPVFSAITGPVPCPI